MSRRNAGTRKTRAAECAAMALSAAAGLIISVLLHPAGIHYSNPPTPAK